jgi:hypothetical protein
MICIERILGAPVMEAAGKSARTIATKEADVSPVTVEVIWNNVGYFSRSKAESTRTLPQRAIRPMSFRTMSTTIAFSARSFTEQPSADRNRSSS